MQFRENIKAMYSLPVSHTHTHTHPHLDPSQLIISFEPEQKPTVGYKGLMTSYQDQVFYLADDSQKGEVQLVVNLFQSVLDGFIRGEMKKEEAEPAKVKH